MSLILIPGASGSGKSHMLFLSVLQEAQAHPEKRFIVLVPEQNTLQTQKTLVNMSECGGIWNIDVLSFTRLAYRVFEQTGVARRQVLSETGKVLLLRLIAAREGARIPLLSGILDRPGMLSEIKSILSEMDQYGIGAGELKEMEKLAQGAHAHPALSRKLSEIALVQEAFERYQADHFITGEKLPRVLSEKAVLDETLKGAVICLDGFTGLTPAQLQVVTTLLLLVEKMTVTVTIDPDQLLRGGRPDLNKIRSMNPGDHELFALSKRTIRSLVDCADQAGAEVTFRFVPETSPGRHAKGSELWWLERHFLRPGREGLRPYPGQEQTGDAPARSLRGEDSCEGRAQEEGAENKPSRTHQIFLRQCADPWDEAVSAAVTIEELVRRGVRYREIAVVCGSLKEYAEYLRRSFAVYGIPCYIDRSSTVVMNPAFEFVRCAIEVLEKNYSYESVMALFRTGLVLDPEGGDIDLLENYLLAAGIRGRKMWEEPFHRMTRDRREAIRAEADRIRAGFMEKFVPFARIMKKSKALVPEYAGAVWQLLLDFDAPAKLDALSRECREEGREDRAQEYAAMIRVICEVLEEASGLMGEETVSRSQFAEILRAGFEEAKIGILPRGIDQVQVADLERSRLEQIRVVLFTGLNDGFVPRRRTSGGVLTDYEREILRSSRIHLAPTAREDANIQQFYLYLALTRPSQALYLSWSSATRSAQELRPSGVLRSIRALFPHARWEAASSTALFESVTSLQTGRAVLARAIGDHLYADPATAGRDLPKLQELVNLFRRNAGFGRQKTEALLQKLSQEERPENLDEETALFLYGEILKGSITRLEEFAACAFRHFADYGLLLREREEFIHRTFGRYLTDEVLEEIMSEKGEFRIGGERRVVSMLFADMRRSTALSEEMDAADFIRMLNHFFGELIEIVNAWQGNILDFVGDSIVVVFGAPRSNDLSARDATACAVAMQRRMRAVNEWNVSQGYPEISMGIGIHTGEAILGNIGSMTRAKYDMIGRNVNLASRIQGYTRGGQILVSDEALAAAGSMVVENEAGAINVKPKGIQDKVWLHDIVGFGGQLLRPE